MKHYLLVVLLVLFLAPAQAQGDVILNVDTTVDDNGLTACTTAPDDCSLRGAITNANNIAIADSITINVPAGYYVLDILNAEPEGGESFNAAGNLNVRRGMSIVGAGADQTIIEVCISSVVGCDDPDGSWNDTILTANNINQVPFDLFMSGMTFQGSSSESTAGIFNSGNNMTLVDVVIKENVSGFGTTGLANFNGVLTLRNSAVVDNTVSNGNLSAAGVANIGGQMTILNSTISGNETFNTVSNPAAGGVLNRNDGDLFIYNSTITNNTGATDQAQDRGAGGVHNESGSVTIQNSIVAGNNGNEDLIGVITSGNYNLFGSINGIYQGTTANDFTDTDPILGPLQINGGATPTHALLNGSPAINNADPAFDPNSFSPALATDQRGLARVSNGRLDIGAYEIPITSLLEVDTTVDDNTLLACTTAPDDCSLRGAISHANSSTAQNITINVPAGTYTLTRTNEFPESGESFNAVGNLNVRRGMSIVGAGAGQTIVEPCSENCTGAILPGGWNDTLVTAHDTTVSPYPVFLSDITFQDSSVEGGSAVFNSANVMTLTGIVIQGHGSGLGGAALGNFNGQMTLRDSAIINNQSVQSAGSNAAGVDNNGGQLTIINSTISGNISPDPLSQPAPGGVLNSNDGTLFIYNSTITNNTSVEDEVQDRGASGVHNESGTVFIKDSIVAGNIGNEDLAGAITSGDYNLFGSINGIYQGTPVNDFTNADPFLGLLQNNGGTTPTHALLNGSPAINTGDPAFDPVSFAPPVNTDQRGFTRVQDGRLDIGAYERRPAVAIPATEALDFGQVSVGSSSVISLTLSNGETDDALEVEGTVILGEITPFSVLTGSDSDCALGTVLAPGDSCQVRVEFAPENIDEFSDSLEIYTTAINPTVTVSLNGEGVMPMTTEPTPTDDPGIDPTPTPTDDPGVEPTPTPTDDPGIDPTPTPTDDPGIDPTPTPTDNPGVDPTPTPTDDPGVDPTPTDDPGAIDPTPTNVPGDDPNLNLDGELGAGTILPTFKWRVTDLADWYNLIVNGERYGEVFNRWFPAGEICTGNLCEYTLTQDDLPVGLRNDTYTWVVNEWRESTEEVLPVGEEEFAVSVPVPTAPLGTQVDASSGRPMVIFPDDPGVTWLNIYISTPDFNDVYDFTWYPKAEAKCDGVNCRLYPFAFPPNGDYALYLQTWGPAGFNGDDPNLWTGPLNFSLDFPPAAVVDPLSATVDSDGTPTFTWNASEGATWYQLWTGTAAPEYDTLHIFWYEAIDLGCSGGGVCTLTLPEVKLSNGVDYEWWVRTWGPGGLLIDSGIVGWNKGGDFTP